MKRIGEVLDLDLPMDGETKELVAVAKLHLTAADTALRVQVKVDEARLRRQQVDILPEIARILGEEKVKLARLRSEGTP